MRLLLGIFICVLASQPVFAEDLFESDEILQVRLSGPVKKLLRNKTRKKDFEFVLQAGGYDHGVKVRARGNSRIELCNFPPLRLDFVGEIPGESPFVGQDDLKLVTHCRSSEPSQTNTLQEYAAYRFFGLLTAAAYRVRLLHISYEDTAGGKKIEKYGFLIESSGALAKRIGGDRVRLPGVTLKSMDDRQEALVYVFQYLIGNTDWSLVSPLGDDECCHNGKLISKNQQLLLIPYDFDMSGLVNAGYARPHPSTGIKRVTQRTYRGFCLDRETLANAIKTYRDHREDFLAIVDGLPGVIETEKQKTVQFIDGFYEETRNEDELLDYFERHCHD